MSKTPAPKSTIQKWLHFDRNYTNEQVYKALGIDPLMYKWYMEKPWEFFTIEQMEKLSFLLDKSLTEVFWACYKRPYKYIFEDNARLRISAALERAGIK
jgi:hypothetical protein